MNVSECMQYMVRGEFSIQRGNYVEKVLQVFYYRLFFYRKMFNHLVSTTTLVLAGKLSNNCRSYSLIYAGCMHAFCWLC